MGEGWERFMDDAFRGQGRLSFRCQRFLGREEG